MSGNGSSSSVGGGGGGGGEMIRVVPVGRRTDYVKLQPVDQDSSSSSSFSNLYMVCDFAKWEKSSGAHKERDHCKDKKADRQQTATRETTSSLSSLAIL